MAIKRKNNIHSTSKQDNRRNILRKTKHNNSSTVINESIDDEVCIDDEPFTEEEQRLCRKAITKWCRERNIPIPEMRF